jgi:hypothetical protein
MERHPKRDAPLAGACAVVFDFPGWVKDFSIGAALGAVFVAGGVE